MTYSTVNSTISETSTLQIVSITIYSILGSIGVVGNAFVLIVMFTVKDLRSYTNIFIINQSFIDMTASLFLLGNFVAPSVPLPRQEWAGKFICSVWNSGFFFWGTAITSTYNLVLLSLERYVAMIHPVLYRSRFTNRLALAVAVVPWIIGFGYEVHWAVANRYSGGQCTVQYSSSIMQKFTGCLTFIVAFLLPIVVMTFVYIKIGKSLRRRVVEINPSSTTATTTAGSNDNNGQEGSSTHEEPAGGNYREKARKNVIKMLLIVCVTYVICWTPAQVLYFYFNFGGASDIYGELYTFTAFIAFLNMCVNPFIYTFKYRKFQRGLKILFKMRLYICT